MELSAKQWGALVLWSLVPASLAVGSIGFWLCSALEIVG